RGNRPMTKLLCKCSPIFLLALMLTSARPAAAQDSCGADDVIQPAIDGAASDAGCNADGAYVSPDGWVDAAEANCIENATNGEKCRHCLRDAGVRAATAIRLLARDGFLTKENA